MSEFKINVRYMQPFIKNNDVVAVLDLSEGVLAWKLYGKGPDIDGFLDKIKDTYQLSRVYQDKQEPYYAVLMFKSEEELMHFKLAYGEEIYI